MKNLRTILAVILALSALLLAQKCLGQSPKLPDETAFEGQPPGTWVNVPGCARLEKASDLSWSFAKCDCVYLTSAYMVYSEKNQRNELNIEKVLQDFGGKYFVPENGMKLLSFWIYDNTVNVRYIDDTIFPAVSFRSIQYTYDCKKSGFYITRNDFKQTFVTKSKNP